MEKAIYFPLRSNAHALLAGAPARSVERRLKVASLFYDHVLIEGGSLSIQAGPNGAITTPLGADENWQSPRLRHAQESAGFSLMMAPEDPPGIAIPSEARTVLESPSAFSWAPTFMPFLTRLPTGCDWITYVSVQPSPGAEAAAKVHVDEDFHNPSLARLLPDYFPRKVVVENANRDLAIGSSLDFGGRLGAAVSLDGMHCNVLAARLLRADGPHPQGFSASVIAPELRTWSWEEIAALRSDRGMAYYRRFVGDLEQEALELTASGQELSAATRTAYDRRIREASDQAQSMSKAAMTTAGSIVIGVAAGVLLAPIPAAGVAAAAPTVSFARFLWQRRRSWRAIDLRLHPSA